MRAELRILDPRLPDWGFPGRGSAEAAGLDLHACLDAPLRLRPGGAPVLISAGFAIRLGSPGYCGLVCPRSGWGHRGLVLGNTVGVIDADYQGPVLLSAWNRNAQEDGDEIVVSPGDRIAQLLILPIARPELDVVEAFEARSARGGGGFGSSGVGAP